MEIVHSFLELPEVQILEELQDALYIANQKKVEDIKTILDKFTVKFQKQLIPELLKLQMEHILNIKPQLYKTFCSILSSFKIVHTLSPPKSNPDFKMTKLYQIILKDDVYAFSNIFTFPRSTQDIHRIAISTPRKAKTPILKLIVGSRAYNIIHYLLVNDVLTNQLANGALSYAVRYHDDFLINLFLSCGHKPTPRAFKEAYKYWNVRYLNYIYPIYSYKLCIENVMASGSVKMVRFFSTIDTKRQSTIKEDGLFYSMFHMYKSRLESNVHQ